MYDTFSCDYDRFVNWPSRLGYELPFLLKHLNTLKKPGAAPVRVLDAACGTGMHAIALAKQGYTVCGADLSAGMVAKAVENAQGQGVQAVFKTAGFGELAAAFATGQEDSPLVPFDAVLCLGNSLPHVLTPRQLQSALDDFAACLRPGGLVFLQNRNFDAVMRAKERWMEPQSHREGNEEWLFLRFYDYLPDNQIDFNIVTLHRSGEDAWQQRITTTRLRPLLQADLLELLTVCGFGEIACYGDMTGQPFNPTTSGNLIVTARMKQ